MSLNKTFNKYKTTIAEFFRYVLIGGTAFVIDFLVLAIFNEFIFNEKYLYLSVFIGYLAGLVFNFFFSCGYVFKDGFKKIKNNEFKCFTIFAIIGIFGLGLTELLMHIFVSIFILDYMLSKILTGGIVMFWNYIARKVIIFK